MYEVIPPILVKWLPHLPAHMLRYSLHFITLLPPHTLITLFSPHLWLSFVNTYQVFPFKRITLFPYVYDVIPSTVITFFSQAYEVMISTVIIWFSPHLCCSLLYTFQVISSMFRLLTKLFHPHLSRSSHFTYHVIPTTLVTLLPPRLWRCFLDTY